MISWSSKTWTVNVVLRFPSWLVHPRSHICLPGGTGAQCWMLTALPTMISVAGSMDRSISRGLLRVDGTYLLEADLADALFIHCSLCGVAIAVDGVWAQFAPVLACAVSASSHRVVRPPTKSGVLRLARCQRAARAQSITHQPARDWRVPCVAFARAR